MSMENAILELAKAMHAVAESNHALAAASLKTDESYRSSITAYAQATAAYSAPNMTFTDVSPEVKPGKSVKATIEPGDPEIEQAVEKVEAAAKEEKKAATPAPKEEKKAEQPAATLDYKADVYPKLVGLAKAKGKPALIGLLKEFDAANGEVLKPEQYAQVVARAAELAA